ncbi:MAG: ParB/RepB/Spo0J family partition protein [Lachnospiraceae bacterium]|nr:ParB/RepB/Spo0J family partition protein [Lachnospiraceae bacterium]
MALKRGLNKGKGLAALIDTESVKDTGKTSGSGDGVLMLNISQVQPNKNQPRKNFNEDELQELAESIKQHGVISPLLVKEREDYYEIVAGERRWRAATLAGLKEVPVIVRDLTEQEIVEISIIENLQRVDLNPIEEALAYKRLMTEFNQTQDEVAEKVSKSRTAIANSVRLLKLSEGVQQMLIDDMISAGHARALLGIENEEEQFILAQRVFDEKLSVRDIEKIVKKRSKENEEVIKRKTETQLSNVYTDIETKLKDRLSTKVKVTGKENGSGKIEIEFFSGDELERILDLIGR